MQTRPQLRNAHARCARRKMKRTRQNLPPTHTQIVVVPVIRRPVHVHVTVDRCDAHDAPARATRLAGGTLRPGRASAAELIPAWTLQGECLCVRRAQNSRRSSKSKRKKLSRTERNPSWTLWGGDGCRPAPAYTRLILLASQSRTAVCRPACLRLRGPLGQLTARGLIH